MNDRSLVLLFLKAPVRGQVKTRLARSVGDESAFELSCCFIRDTFDALVGAGHQVRACFTPATEEALVSSLLGGHRDLHAQQGADLGERMEHAFCQAFSEGFSKVVLLGSDIPDLPSDIVSEAFSALASKDLVLGPAQDGGYYLIGSTAARFLPEVLHGIPWSTSGVLSLTLRAAEHAGIQVHLLPEWYDVDTAADLRALIERNRDSAFTGSRTLRYLKKGGLL